MKLLAGGAVLLAIGAGLGTYFGLRGPSAPEVPKAQQSAILEQAKVDGVIRGYRVRHFDSYGWDYRVAGADIRFSTSLGLCGVAHHGPACLGPTAPILVLEYRRSAAEAAYAIQRIAQTRMPQAQVKLFEVTTLNGGSLAPIARGYAASTHIPDARIMLIPKAGA